MWTTKAGAAALVIVLAACGTTAERNVPANAERIERPSQAPPATAAVAEDQSRPPVTAARGDAAGETPRPARQSVAERTAGPVAQVQTRPRPEPVPKPESEPTPEPKPEPETRPKPEPTVKPKPATAAQPKPKPVPKPAPDQPPEPAATHTISGRLELDAGAGQSVSAGEVAQAVVYFLPRSGGARPKAGRFRIDTHSKGFKPNLLVVPVGSTVSFPNKDQILHNVFSTTPGTAFDLGTYGPGETRSTRFAKAGLVTINCNVHQNMHASVLVLSTPYYARPRADGRFVLDGLPPGPGTLVFWHPRARAQSQAIPGPLRQPLLKRLVASRPPLDHVH